MTTLSIPSRGLALSSPDIPKERGGDGTTQIIRLDLPKSKSKAIFDMLRSGKKVSLQTGKQMSVQYGEKKIALQTSSELFPSDFYLKSSETDGQAHFSGKLSHTLEIRKAREATAKADEALATLENTLKSMREERAQNEVSLLQTKDDVKLANRKDYKPSPLLGASFRKDHLLGGMTRSTPSSPHLGASRSPNHGPTSAPLLGAGGGVMSKDKVRLEAIKIPLIHLLACRPLSSKSIVDKLRAPKDDCDRLLEKYARDSPSSPGKKELKEKTYKDLDVWKFPYQNEADRMAAIDRAIHSFDRMRLEKADSIWQLLLPPMDRGKGKVLSRLKLNKPVAPQASLKPERGDGKGYASDIEDSKSAHKKKLSGSKAAEKKPSADASSTANSKARAPSPLQEKKDASSKAHNGVKADSKFKSAERIEDSDEEAEGLDVVDTEAVSTKVKRESARESVTSAQFGKRNLSPKKQIHKSTLSNSSSGSDSSDNQNSGRSLKPPSRDHTTKHSPRSRHDSSPQKPSPLGSSLTNSTDADSSSSSKQSQSSAPSSPPSSMDMPIAKQKQKYSPVVSEKPRDVSRGRAPVKRKADEHEPLSPAKRRQVNGVHTEYPVANGMKRSTERPPLARKTTDSDQSSSSEKGPPAREEVVDEAKRFQLYYKKYKELHEKLESKPEKERDEKDVENLLNMHKRLKEMKAEIWGNWEKVENTAK